MENIYTDMELSLTQRPICVTVRSISERDAASKKASLFFSLFKTISFFRVLISKVRAKWSIFAR